MKKSPPQRFSFEPQWFAIGVFFLAGLFLGGLGIYLWFFHGQDFFSLQKIHAKRTDKYVFTNQLLAVDTLERKAFLEQEDLEKKLNASIDRAKQTSGISEAAVYFRDLELGTWAGVNQELKFSPGKILKLALLIADFKRAENLPEILDKKLPYVDVGGVNISTSSEEYLTFGTSYPIGQLIEHMITFDDDLAANIIFDEIEKKALNDVYSDLAIPYNENKEDDDYLTVKSYSLMFRTLYNATYLNRDFSEKALFILSQTSPLSGITAGLPNDLNTAHKYRTRTFNRNGKTLQESHDCGIVYIPNHPYLQCMMAIGKSEEATDALFSKLNQIIYGDMTNKYHLLQ